MLFPECLDFYSGFGSVVLAAIPVSKIIIVKNGSLFRRLFAQIFFYFYLLLLAQIFKKEDLQLLLLFIFPNFIQKFQDVIVCDKKNKKLANIGET